VENIMGKLAISEMVLFDEPSNKQSVKIVDGGLCFYFLFSLYFIFVFFFFYFLEQLGLGFISHAVTSVTN